MSVDDMYTSLEAFIEQDQINWMATASAASTSR